MSTPPDPRVPVPPRPLDRGRVGAAAAAVIVLAGGVTLLALESCAQSTASRPVQAEPPPPLDQPSQPPVAPAPPGPTAPPDPPVERSPDPPDLVAPVT